MALTSSKLNIIVVLTFCVCYAQAVCTCEKTAPSGNCVCQSDNSNPAQCKVCVCDHITKYVNGPLVCSCRPGYAVSRRDRKKCLEINECADTTSPVCEQQCRNTPGSFICSCDDGYLINTADHTKCDEINECADTTSPVCEQQCRNTPGSFICSCDDGYLINTADHTKCDEINECADTTSPVCEQQCRNTPGSFICSCDDGYLINTADHTKCDDINECENQSTSPCEQICTNTNGSYLCSCYPGYNINSTDGSRCEAPCAAYVSLTATTFAASSHKACFNSCAEHPLCHFYEYDVGSFCNLYFVDGNAHTINAFTSSYGHFHIACRNVTSPCFAFSQYRQFQTLDKSEKACFESCTKISFCYDYDFTDAEEDYCTHAMLSEVKDTSVEQYSYNFIYC